MQIRCPKKERFVEKVRAVEIIKSNVYGVKTADTDELQESADGKQGDRPL